MDGVAIGLGLAAYLLIGPIIVVAVFVGVFVGLVAG